MSQGPYLPNWAVNPTANGTVGIARYLPQIRQESIAIPEAMTVPPTPPGPGGAILPAGQPPGGLLENITRGRPMFGIPTAEEARALFEQQRLLEEARNNPIPIPQGYQVQRGSAPFTINPGSPIYDGDFVTLSTKAWTDGSHYGTILFREGNGAAGSKISSAFETSLRNVGVRRGPHQFLLRRVKKYGRSTFWVLDNPSLTGEIKTIGYGDPFIILATDVSNAVLATEPVDRTAFARSNENRPVKFRPWPGVSAETYAKCSSGTLGTATSECTDTLGQATAVWYFERPNDRFGLANPVYVDMGHRVEKNSSKFVLIRSWYGKEADNVFYNGGRNLMFEAGSGGQRVKTALHNNDSDDKQLWLVSTYKGDNYPVQRYNVAPTGQQVDPTGAEFATLNALKVQVDPRNIWQRIFAQVTGQDWNALPFYEKAIWKVSLGLTGAVVGITVLDTAVEKIL